MILTSFQVRPTDMEVDECNIPTATTYAEAANVSHNGFLA